MGPAKLQKTKHTFLHYYDLQILFKQYHSLNTQYNHLKETITNDTRNEFENNDKIIEFIQNSIDDKINHLIINPENARYKRGLVNGLGSIIKAVTGNLDAEDEKRYSKILDHLQNNQQKINNQLKHQYSVNQKLTEQFNKTLETIKQNENILKSKIEQLLHVVVGGALNQNKLFIHDIYTQFNTLFTMTLNVLQDIENSLTFCKLHVMHPSIIKSHDLFVELNKIYKYYNNELPLEPIPKNMPELEKMITVNCKLESDKIIYFIEIPVNYATEFNLFHLLPIPTKYQSEFVTVIPNKNYFLKSVDGHIKSLNGLCTKGNNYQCPNKINEVPDDSCEKNIILKNDNKNCQYIKINIKRNHIEVLEEVNQFVAVFPTPGTINSYCKQGDEVKNLQGIFLIQEDDCKIEFQNQILTFNNETYGKPIVLENYDIQLNMSHVPKIRVDLNTIQELKLPINKYEEINEDEVTSNINYPIIILYVLLIIISISLFAVYLQKRIRKSKSNQGPSKPRSSIEQSRPNLPDEAQI